MNVTARMVRRLSYSSVPMVLRKSPWVGGVYCLALALLLYSLFGVAQNDTLSTYVIYVPVLLISASISVALPHLVIRRAGIVYGQLSSSGLVDSEITVIFQEDGLTCRSITGETFIRFEDIASVRRGLGWCLVRTAQGKTTIFPVELIPDQVKSWFLYRSW
jgi:hypothetical protein